MRIDSYLLRFYGALYNRKNIPSRFLSPIRYAMRKLSNFVIPIYYKRNGFETSNKRNGERRIIVSLTSFPKRIDRVWITIQSLLRQSRPADYIVLYLSKEQFPRKEDLPYSLKTLEGKCFKINFVDNDYRSHKKYLYSFNEYKNDIVILADDDIIYPMDMIESLYLAHQKYPNSVICRYGLKIRYNDDGLPASYNTWEEDYNNYSEDFFFGSGGGTLFEPQKLYQDTTNIEIARKLTPLADDVWLNAMTRLSKLDVVVISNKLLMPVINLDNIRLTEQNVGNNKNDEQINAVMSYYTDKIGMNPFFKQ